MKHLLTLTFAAALLATSSSAWAGSHARRANVSNAPARSTTPHYNGAAISHNNAAALSRNNQARFSRNYNPSLSRNSAIQRNFNNSRNANRFAALNKNGKGHHHHNHIIFVGSFGYPYWGYPYSYYGSGYGYGYGYGYPYGYSYYPSQYTYDSNSYSSNDEAEYGYNQQGGGSIVIEIQRHLSREGFYKGTIDGVMGSRTRYAIRAYKRSHGLRADSEIDNQLLGAMRRR